MGHLLDVQRYKGEITTKLVATFTLFCRRAECNLLVCRVLFQLVLLLIHFSMADSLLHGGWFLWMSTYYFAGTIIIVPNKHHFIDGSRDLKAVLILYQYDVFSLESCDDTTARLAEKTYFITYLHLIEKM